MAISVFSNIFQS